MTRRHLFALLAGAAATAADPERLLWTPGKRLICIPRPRFVTAREVTDELLAQLQRNWAHDIKTLSRRYAAFFRE